MAHRPKPPHVRPNTQIATPRGDFIGKPSTDIGAPSISFEIYWSSKRLRALAWIILIASLMSLPWPLLQSATPHPFALVWMIVLFLAASAIARRAISKAPIVVINRDGILDRRLQSDPIYWSDIDAVAPCDPKHSHVLELYLKWPEYQLTKSRFRVRLGGLMQRRLGVPALTMSLLLLDCSLAGLCDAIATFRPGLLPSELNRHD